MKKTPVGRKLPLADRSELLGILKGRFEETHADLLGSPALAVARKPLSDTGILHGRLGIRTNAELERHPKVGTSWEGFALEQIVSRLELRPERCFFWSTYQGAELDLFVTVGGRRLGFEIKSPRAHHLHADGEPTLTPAGRAPACSTNMTARPAARYRPPA